MRPRRRQPLPLQPACWNLEQLATCPINTPSFLVWQVRGSGGCDGAAHMEVLCLGLRSGLADLGWSNQAFEIFRSVQADDHFWYRGSKKRKCLVRLEGGTGDGLACLRGHPASTSKAQHGLELEGWQAASLFRQ